MNRRSMLVTTLAGLAAWTVSRVRAVELAARPADPLPWYYDLYEAHRVAIQTGRPMLVVFGARWCRYCQKLDETTLSNEKVQQHIVCNFVPVTLNLDHNRSIAKALEVKSIPCSVVLNANADLLGRIVGYVEPDRYQQVLVNAMEFDKRIQHAGYVERTDSRNCTVPAPPALN